MRAHLTARFWDWVHAYIDRLVYAVLGPERPPAPPAVPLELTPETRAAIRRTLT